MLFEWLHKRICLARSEDFRAIGRVVDGVLVGVVGFNGFNDRSVQLHMAGEGKRWISRKFISEVFNFAFVTCGCNVVFGIVPSGNVKALEIDLRLGFTEFARIDGAHSDGALHFLMMRRENCRWI